MTSTYVQWFNSISSKMTYASEAAPVKYALEGLTSLSEKLKLKLFKDFFVKPIMLAGIVQKFTLGEADSARVAKITVDAGIVKTWLSVPDFLLGLPKVFSSFKPIKEGDVVRNLLRPIGKAVAPGLKLSQQETVFKRLSSVASLFIGFGDDVNFIKQYVGLPKCLDKAVPWLQTVAGAYMGAQGMYQEYRFRQNTVFRDYHYSENYLSLATLAMSVSYAFHGAVGLVGLYLGEKVKVYPLFSRCQFAASCAVYLVPIFQYGVEQYRNSFVSK